MEPLRAIRFFQQSHNQFLASFQELEPESLLKAQVEGEWTIKELISHLTSWNNTLLFPLRRHSSDQEITIDLVPDVLEYNREQSMLWDSKDFHQALEEFQSAVKEILKRLNQLPPEAWQRTYQVPWGGRDSLANIVAGLADHAREHTESIQHWRQINVESTLN